MTADLEEVTVDGVTSKGSRFYKAVYSYPEVLNLKTQTSISSGNLLVEINSFANPYPFETKRIISFIEAFLDKSGNQDLITENNLYPFEINVLDKRRTMVEKLVSLIRFSFSENHIVAISSKIRHFYDLHFLVNDKECADYLRSSGFQKDFIEIYKHDQEIFEEPKNWASKPINQSPLIADFPVLWMKLKEVYVTELSQLAFSKIPEENKIADNFVKLSRLLNTH